MLGNIIDYLYEYGDKLFCEHHFSEVDVLLLAQLSYLKFDGVIPAIGARRPPVTLAEIDKRMNPDAVFADKWYEKQNRELWRVLTTCRRYADMGCNFYRSRLEKEEEMQFAAVTFFPADSEPVVVFRGTDESITGWKEDFNLAFKEYIPAQKMSALYLNQVSCRLPGGFKVCGHSKGGNLAVYAALRAAPDVQNKMREIYSLDGPGFLPHTLSGDSYERIAGKIRRILPYSSLVGMLLQNAEEYEVVKSSAFGVMQHDCYTWQIADGAFVKLPDIEERQKRMTAALNEWIFSLSQEERERFVHTLFAMIGETKAETVSAFAEDWRNNLKICLRYLRRMDADTRNHIRQVMKVLIGIYRNAAETAVRQELGKDDAKDGFSY